MVLVVDKPRTVWRIISVPEHPSYPVIHLIVETDELPIVTAIERAATAHGILLERVYKEDEPQQSVTDAP
jgi:hypothetical protein